MSLEASLAKVAAELESVRAWMRDVSDRQQADHDKLIRQEGENVRVRDLIVAVQREVKGLRTAIATDVEALEGDLATFRTEVRNREREGAKKKEDRSWQVWMAVLGPVVSAIITAAITALLLRGGP